MQFHYGHPPTPHVPFENPEKLDIDYTRLHLWALILALVVLGPTIFLVSLPVVPIKEFLNVFELGPFAFLGLLLLTVVVHEVLHMMTHPGFGFSRSSFFGILPKSFLIYASYQGTQSRARLTITLLTPFLVLTLGMLAACKAGLIPASWMPMASGIALLNGMAAAGDLILTWIVMTKIPAGARIAGDFFEGAPIRAGAA